MPAQPGVKQAGTQLLRQFPGMPFLGLRRRRFAAAL